MQAKIEIDETSWDIQTREENKTLFVSLQGKEIPVSVQQKDQQWVVSWQGKEIALSLSKQEVTQLLSSQKISLAIEGALTSVRFQKERESKGLSQDLVGDVSDNVLLAFMPGTIVRILVQEGQEVQEGQVLFILEAMKMENEIKAPKLCKIESISTEEGKAVNKGDLIMTLLFTEDPLVEG